MTKEEEKLFQKRDLVTSILRRIAAAPGDKQIVLIQELRSLVPFGVYEHFKSTSKERKLYTVLGIITATDNPAYFAVAYFAHYGARAGWQTSKLLVGESAFFEPAKDPANPKRFVKRFRIVAPAASITHKQALIKMGLKIS